MLWHSRTITKQYCLGPKFSLVVRSFYCVIITFAFIAFITIVFRDFREGVRLYIGTIGTIAQLHNYPLCEAIQRHLSFGTTISELEPDEIWTHVVNAK